MSCSLLPTTLTAGCTSAMDPVRVVIIAECEAYAVNTQPMQTRRRLKHSGDKFMHCTRHALMIWRRSIASDRH